MTIGIRLIIAGSCRPLILIKTFSFVFKLTLLWVLLIDGVGLIAHLKTIGIPLVIPPLIPPLWLVIVEIFPSLIINSSFAVEPTLLANSKPSPNSIPLIPPIPNMHLEIKPSQEEKCLSPRPNGTL